MACSSCGTENPESSKFCRECGARLSLACASCGTSITPGTKFCPECGASQQVAVEAERPVTTPSAAERRLVSILFADLVGFTPLAESRDPEETRELLDRYFGVAREIVGRYGGSVEKFIGDAVMAVWGTPTAHEDDPERAVRAALEMVEAVRHLRGEVGIAELELRAGVLTGEAAVTVGAADQAMVAGDLVNTAARLQSVAPPGGVLVGESTRGATEGAIAYEPVGEAQLKGKATPVKAFRALRVVAQRGGAGRSHTIEPPFVGRDAEFRLIKDLFHATGDERRPRLVSVMGQAGIGKSRLAWELLKYIDGVTELAYWHHGRSPAYGEGVAFWALGEMVRGRAGIAEGEDSPNSRSKLRATLDEFVTDPEERRWIEAPLQQLLGIGESETAPVARETLFAAWRTLFERISERATVVMVFEDLHWADPGLLDFIEHLLDWSRTHPIYILALARPELTDRRSDWGLARRNVVSLALEPLAQGPMRELLDGIVSGLAEPVERSILERAEGIPLYAVEIVRMLIAEGRLEASDGIYRPVGELGAVALPGSLHALIAARLDALEAGDRQLLQGASVLGKTFTLEAIAAIENADPTALEAPLRSLVRREMLRVEADPRSPERGQYGFVQSLIREVAYSTLARRERRRLHLAAARHFEALGDDELAGILATHYVDAYRAQPDGPEGEAVAAQARVALRGAADRAVALGSHLQALGYLEQALEVTPEPGDRASILEAAAAAGVHAGASAKALQFGQEAIRLRREEGEREPILRATAILGMALNYAASVEEAAELLESAATEYEDLADTPAYVAVAAQLSRAYMRTGQYERAVATADGALPTAERLDLVRETLELLVNKGTSLAHTRVFEGGAVLLGAIELARLRDLPDVEIRAIINLQAVVEAEDPRLNQAPRALELVRRFGLRNFLTYLVWNAAEAALSVGEWDWAIATEAEAMASAVTEEQRADVEGNAIAIRIFRGEADAAEVERIWAPLMALSDPQINSGRLLSLGRLALVQGRLAEAHRMGMESRALSLAHAHMASELAARAALWAGDLEAAGRAREALALRHGRASRNVLRTADAGIAALEGRRADALAAYREAIRTWREFGLEFTLAFTVLDMLITLGPEEAEAAALAEEAREIFNRLRAAPLVKKLDEVMSPAPPVTREARTEEPARR